MKRSWLPYRRERDRSLSHRRLGRAAASDGEEHAGCAFVRIKVYDVAVPHAGEDNDAVVTRGDRCHVMGVRQRRAAKDESIRRDGIGKKSCLAARDRDQADRLPRRRAQTFIRSRCIRGLRCLRARDARRAPAAGTSPDGIGTPVTIRRLNDRSQRHLSPSTDFFLFLSCCSSRPCIGPALELSFLLVPLVFPDMLPGLKWNFPGSFSPGCFWLGFLLLPTEYS